ncbi:MAG: C2 family cysteine protease, partial [Gemmataceae bacterium]
MFHGKEKLRARPNLESLEERTVLSVTSATLTTGTLSLVGNNAVSNVSIRQEGSLIRIKDTSNGFNRTFNRSAVNVVQFKGGSADDQVINFISNMPLQAWGNGGNDYLEGYNAVDALFGGDGDDTLVGYGGNDILVGNNGNDKMEGMAGNDVLLGGDGNDKLYGDAGNDQLNGGAGADSMYGGSGSDVLISLDASTSDVLEGNTQRDIFWRDAGDVVAGLETHDVIQTIARFSNSADLSLNGDRIADPRTISSDTYRRFANNPLFSQWGPRLTDIRQGAIGDCYFLAALGGVVQDNSFAIRQRVVDFNDGTYGVRLGSEFYRVDDDLPVFSLLNTRPAYADLGASNSMWVAIMEKAYAHYRTGENSYESIEGGWMTEVYPALGSTVADGQWFDDYSTAAEMANDILNRWMSFQSVTLGFLDV